VDDKSFAGPEYTDGLPAETHAIVGSNPLLDATRRPQGGSPPNRGAFSGP